MNVSLTPELEQFIQAKLTSGTYHSASEVIREGLRLLKERDQLQEMNLAALREEILKGVQQADQGMFSDSTIENIKAEGRQRLLDQQQVAVRLPKALLAMSGIENDVEIAVTKGAIIIRPAEKTRQGWAEHFEAMACYGDDSLLDDRIPTEWDKKDWECT